MYAKEYSEDKAKDLDYSHTDRVMGTKKGPAIVFDQTRINQNTIQPGEDNAYKTSVFTNSNGPLTGRSPMSPSNFNAHQRELVKSNFLSNRPSCTTAPTTQRSAHP